MQHVAWRRQLSSCLYDFLAALREVLEILHKGSVVILVPFNLIAQVCACVDVGSSVCVCV